MGASLIDSGAGGITSGGGTGKLLKGRGAGIDTGVDGSGNLGNEVIIGTPFVLLSVASINFVLSRFALVK
jgi:hypothetical protein